MKTSTYIHEEYTHDLVSPREIVPSLMRAFKPASVIDVGCGIGTFLYCFKEKGVKEVLGVDGSWTNKELVAKYLQPGEFVESDLDNDISVDKRFDMALCLEVAEHIAADRADVLVKNLTRLSNVIIFSAAIPGQGGQNHINEQLTSYWQEKFRQHDFYFLDVLRPYLWNNEKVHWWYRQNMFVVLHKSLLQNGFEFPAAANTNNLLTYVHPQLLNVKEEDIIRLKTGKYPLTSYLKFIYKKFIPGK